MLKLLRQQQEVVAGLAPVFETLLGEPHSVSRKLAKSWFRHFRENQLLFTVASNATISESISRASQIINPDLHQVAQFMNRCSSGIVLATIHMGDYLHSILQILKEVEARDVFVLRREVWTDADQAIMKIAEAGHLVTPVVANADAARVLLRGLRKGGIAVMLYDLPQRWGATEEVQMFNQPFAWVSGPVQLASLARGCLLPFYCFNEDSQMHCEFGAVRDYRHIQSATSELTCSEMQHLVNAAEAYIRSNPEQWENWRLVSEMLVNQSQGSDDGRTAEALSV